MSIELDALTAVVGCGIGFAGMKTYLWRRHGYRNSPKDTHSGTLVDSLATFAAEHQARLAGTVGIADADQDAGEAADPSLTGIPDLIEPIIGWRAWSVDANGTLRALHGGGSMYGHGPAWEPRKAVVATCNSDSRMYAALRDNTEKHHIAPMQNCGCGYYAALSPRDVPSVREGIAYGLVAMWGKVVEHSGGWRAQYAYPINVTLIPGGDWGKTSASMVLSRIRRLYGVPARLGTKTEYTELCADHLSTAPLPEQIAALLEVAP